MEGLQAVFSLYRISVFRKYYAANECRTGQGEMQYSHDKSARVYYKLSFESHCSLLKREKVAEEFSAGISSLKPAECIWRMS